MNADLVEPRDEVEKDMKRRAGWCRTHYAGCACSNWKARAVEIERDEVRERLEQVKAEAQQMVNNYVGERDFWQKEAANAEGKASRYKEQLEQAQAQNKDLKRALLKQLCDLHENSSRPCATCSESRKALGMDVKLGCTFFYLDGPKELRKALETLE